MSQEQETPLSASPVEAKRQIGNVTTNVTLGTLVMTVVAWGLSEFGGVVIPAEVALAVASLVNILIGYATKPGRGKRAL